ncbi:MAG: fasciclin domain-containing protein [Bacteroidota bacterium]
MKKTHFLLVLLLVLGLTRATALFAQSTSETLVSIASSDPDFSTLSQLIRAAGLEQTLSGPGPFTLFAPTNAAFNNLQPGALENLLKPENKQRLVAILTAHLLNGSIHSSDFFKENELRSVQGKTLEINEQGGKLTVDQSNVVKTDLSASNGVFHIIDKVIMP